MVSIESPRAKVRYGRASLTVSCTPTVIWTPVFEALNALPDGDATEEDVAWAFVRNQVIKTSPTFSWDAVDLDIILPRIAAVMREPRFKARTTAELVSDLRVVENKELEVVRKAQTGLQETAKQWSQMVAPQFDLNKFIGSEFKLSQPDFSGFTHFTTNYDKTFENYLGQVPQMKTVFQGLNNLTWTTPFTNAFRERAKVVTFHGALDQGNWPIVVDGFVGAAENVGEVEAAEIVEGAAETVKETESLDLGEAIERLRPMFANLEKAVRNSTDSTTKLLFVAVAAGLLVILIQMLLAHYGIQVIPPAPPAR